MQGTALRSISISTVVCRGFTSSRPHCARSVQPQSSPEMAAINPVQRNRIQAPTSVNFASGKKQFQTEIEDALGGRARTGNGQVHRSLVEGGRGSC
jgi:hypothetical protein